MKCLAACLAIIVFLGGCGEKYTAASNVDVLREKLKNSNGAVFEAQVTAYYSDSIFDFTLDCETFADGSMNFTVAEPDTIEDIAGSVQAQGGRIAFDDTVLGFPLLAQGEISPVSAPWLFYNALLDGYVGAVSRTENGCMISVEESYHQEDLRIDICITNQQIADFCEIYWQNQRVLSVQILDFRIK